MDIILLFYRTEHNYSVFCNQKQGSTKSVNANLSGNLYGATSHLNFRNYSTIVWLSLPALKGLLMRVHYPKLRNIVHTISL